MTQQQWIAVLNGALNTIQLTVFSVLVGLVLGLFIAMGRIAKNKVINGLAWIYVWIFRGTPLLLQILVVYYALPSFGIQLTAYMSALVALSLNSGAYLAEIMRAAIQSIDKGQMEAAKALGMGYSKAMFKVIIPQSYRRMIPPIGNEAIMLLKDSSLVSVMGMTELLRVSRNMANNTGNMMYYGIAALVYLFFTTIFTVIFQNLEKKYAIYD